MTIELQVRLWIAAFACVAVSACSSPPAPELRAVSGEAQGTTYSLQWWGGAGEAEVAAAAADELERIDALLSNYRPDSTLEQLNAARSTGPLEVPAELVSLLALAKRIHAASGGCFDPTVRPLVRVWGFDRDEPAVPAEAAIDAVRETVGLDKLELLDATHVRKGRAELAIDMASIGQGYTAGQLGALLARYGSSGYLAEIGGEIVAHGQKPDGSAWRIGVENPLGGEPGPALRMPEKLTTVVITSGSYRQYFEADGRRFGHIIDPRSGWPVTHDLLSVTVVGTDAASAAAWATALLCLGPGEGASIAERENIAALLWVADDDRAVLERTPALPEELLEGPR